MPLVRLQAPAIECDGCARSICRTLGKLAGVTDVSVDVGSKVVSVEFNPASVTADAIAARLEQAGFPAAAGEAV